jgi:hypothetical protein
MDDPERLLRMRHGPALLFALTASGVARLMAKLRRRGRIARTRWQTREQVWHQITLRWLLTGDRFSRPDPHDHGRPARA